MPREILCPKCGAKLQTDEETYNSIAQQIRNAEFEKEVDQAKTDLERALSVKVELAKAEVCAQMNLEIQKRDKTIMDLQAAKAKAAEEASKEILDLKETISTCRASISDRDNAIAGVKRDALAMHANMEDKLKQQEEKSRLEIQNAVAEERMKSSDKDNIIAQLKTEISNMKLMHAEEISAIRDKQDAINSLKDEEIAQLKDFKSKLSVKLLGETFEQHCLAEYNLIRHALPNSRFTKDNDASSGSKGDFLYVEHDDKGNEVLSIMFEMKEESDISTNKHKNEDFLKKLDKDRKEKGCEYAVLVSRLESDNETYNRGIVDVSHLYPKMYVIRPQFFLILLMLLRSMAMDRSSLRKKMHELEKRQIDISNFETDLNDFKDAVLKCHYLANSNKEKALKRLDNAIQLLQDIKEDLIHMDKHMETARNKAEKVTIQKLAKKHPQILSDAETSSSVQVGANMEKNDLEKTA